ncbi:endonuclease/exonuclease/phosphatase family protein [Roseibium aggregatum]|uniref:endonuclease/exonuclease/phosphatase family protein n=1 Tax=Roseibium aggregatum TaxID=187304 RepID=UPI0025AD4B1A|nr:endonuclease/exonuclease/phosphatase family protein [Roseibium aggregatum]WJS04298.1 endonuclease/exonuclease/phosphatase family protein [Roseibium aggregatum]
MFRKPQAKPRSLIHSVLSLIGWCGSLGAIAVSVLGLLAFLAPDVWLADNMSFFLRQFLAAGLAGCLGGAAGFLVRHRLRLMYRLTWFVAVIAFLSLAGFTGARTLANTKPLGPAAPGDRPLKIVSINLEHLFLGDKVLQAFLEKEQPDVVVFQEVLWWLQERRWQRLGLLAGGAGKNGFPEYLKVGDLGGLAVYSRFPLTSEETRVISGDVPPGANVYYDGDRELLSLSVDTGSAPLHLLVIHPDSPRSKIRWENKRRYFDEADHVIDTLKADNGSNILAIGDWNSSPWSARFQQTLTRNGLKTAYPDGWPQTTRFFFDYSLHWILGAPVDQFAVSRDIQIVNVSLGPDIGSDHLPLIVEIAQTPAN